MAYSQRQYKAALERLNNYVKTHSGMRPSKKRMVVFDKLWELEQPFTAAQIVEACQDKVSIGTVYNVLDLFILAQILQGVNRQRGKSERKYWLINPRQMQIRMFCSKCGRVTELHDKAIEALVNERIYSNFVPEQYALFIYGECKLCRKRK